MTIDGPKPIEEVREGDEVLSMPEDGDESGEPVWRVVEAAYERQTAIIDLAIEAPDGTTVEIGTTHEHPFWIGGRGWTKAENIRPDDYVWSVERGWLWVRSVHERPEEEPVYNVRVADDHTYFVSELAIWVHNTKACPDPPTSEPARINSTRVIERAANEPGPYHNFPAEFDAEIFETGSQSVVKNFYNKPKAGYSNDSIQYSLPGSINGREGTFGPPSVSLTRRWRSSHAWTKVLSRVQGRRDRVDEAERPYLPGARSGPRGQSLDAPRLV